MKTVKIYYFIIFVILSGSCDSTSIPEPYNSPEFTFHIKGTLGGNDLDIKAGENNYYMYTDFSLNNHGIYEFSGEFAKEPDCTTDCEEALNILISSDTGNDDFDINDALFIGDYTFMKSTLDTSIQFQVTFEPIATATSFIGGEWDFGDGNISMNLFASHNFTDTFPLVQLETTDLFGNRSRVRTHINLENGTNCQKDFYSTYNTSNDLYTFKLFQPAQNLSYNWFINDGQNTITHTGTSFTYNVNTSGLFEVCLEVNDNGCISEICKTYNNQTKTLVSATTFDYEVGRISVIDIEELLSKVQIIYTTKDGTLFSSTNGVQPAISRFEVLNTEDFRDNENGLPTKKITAAILCSLFDDNGNVLVLDVPSFVFGIAYPN